MNTYNWKIAFFYNAISRFGVPNFFMISGALFLNRDISYKKMFNKYIKKLVINLVVWSFFYSVINNNISELRIKKIIINFFFGPRHLWFLFVIIGLYMIVPFLREISKRDDLLQYFLILSFIFTFVIPNINYFISCYSIIISQIIESLNKNFNMNFIKGYVFYYMFGYYLNNITNMNIYKKIFIYLCGLIGFYFTVIILYRNSVLNKKKKDIILFRALNLNILAYSTSVFIAAKMYFNSFNSKIRYYLQKLSKYSFGIYLVHPFIIKNVYKYHYYFTFKNILYRIPFISLLVFILSLILSIIIKSTPFIGNYIL